MSDAIDAEVRNLLSKIIHAIIEHPEDLIICEMRQDETLAFTISGSPHASHSSSGGRAKLPSRSGRSSVVSG